MKNGECPDYWLGDFAEKKDAILATKLVLSIFKDFEDEFNLKAYGSFRMDKEIKPETYTRYYKDIADFVKGNKYTQYFLKIKGKEDLEQRLKMLADSEGNKNQQPIGDSEAEEKEL